MAADAGLPLTAGIHHVGLSVSRLEASADFFVRVLGWQAVRRDDNYPAVFVSDGTTMVSLWGIAEPSTAFDRRRNTGLHHLALRVSSLEGLMAIHQRILDEGLVIEFAPELLRLGPAMHMMCYEPSGIRVEFIWAGY